MTSLQQSYAHCRRTARLRARNFYYSFLLLPREQRDAMCAIYAFMRRCDDLSDEPGASKTEMAGWRRSLDEALEGRYDGSPVWPAFHDTVRRFGIPRRYFHEMIDGVASDIEPRPIETFDDLYAYCYRVASVVGLTIVHIFGYESAEAIALAEKCGIAFQLTNILRDVREDAGMGRIYLPAEDLRRFDVDPAILAEGRLTPGMLELLRFQAARARRYYDESAPLIDLVNARSRSSLWALIAIYRRLLERIEENHFDVFSRRISLPGVEKAWIVLRAACGATRIP